MKAAQASRSRSLEKKAPTTSGRRRTRLFTPAGAAPYSRSTFGAVSQACRIRRSPVFPHRDSRCPGGIFPGNSFPPRSENSVFVQHTVRRVVDAGERAVASRNREQGCGIRVDGQSYQELKSAMTTRSRASIGHALVTTPYLRIPVFALFAAFGATCAPPHFLIDTPLRNPLVGYRDLLYGALWGFGSSPRPECRRMRDTSSSAHRLRNLIHKSRCPVLPNLRDADSLGLAISGPWKLCRLRAVRCRLKTPAKRSRSM